MKSDDLQVLSWLIMAAASFFAAGCLAGALGLATWRMAYHRRRSLRLAETEGLALSQVVKRK